jgi:hypothetical protein
MRGRVAEMNSFTAAARHDDVHPSLSINATRDVWMCGPCGVGGTAWQLAAFLAGVEPSNKHGVLEWLKQPAGRRREDPSNDRELSAHRRDSKSIRPFRLAVSV